jgi:hypothetical protein
MTSAFSHPGSWAAHRLDYGLALAAGALTLAAGWAAVRFAPAWGWPMWPAIGAAVLAVALAFATTRRVLFVSPQIALAIMYVMLIQVAAIGYYHSDHPGSTRFVLLSSLALLAFSVPLALAWLHGGLPEPEGGIVNDLAGETELTWNIFAAAGVAGALWFLVRGASATGGLPLLHLFHGFASVHSLDVERLAFADGSVGYTYEFYGVILPVTAVAFMLRWLATGSRRHRQRALFLLGLAAFTLVAAGYRNEVELFFLVVVIALSYGLGGLANKVGAAVAVFAVAAFLLLSAGIYSNPGADTTTAQATQARIFQIQADGPEFVAQNWPSPYPYYGGAEIVQGLEGALHTHKPGFAQQLPALRGVRSLSNPVGAAFEGYVNFGPAGLAAVMLVLGCATVAVHRRLARKRTVSAIALGSGLSAALASASVVSISGVLLQYGVVTVGLMAVAQGLMRAAGPRSRRRPCLRPGRSGEAVMTMKLR